MNNDDKLIELKALKVRLKSGEYDGADIMKAWIAIDELAQLVRDSEWISVKDELPVEMPYRFQPVFVAKSNGVVMEAMYNTKTKQFMSCTFFELRDDVTHWKPLPSPPKQP